MTWAKVDDQLHAHRKAKLAWKYHPRALGLHLLSLSYCAGQLTDGFVDLEFVEEKLPAGRERDNVTSALVSAGLWVPEGDGWRINDWLEYNPSRADVLAKRERDSARKARGRGTESTQSPNGIPAESGRPRARGPAAVARPDPTHTPLSPPPAGGRKRSLEVWERAALGWARAAGVEGAGESLLRAVRQSQPWAEDSPEEHYRAFVRDHFPSLEVA